MQKSDSDKTTKTKTSKGTGKRTWEEYKKENADEAKTPVPVVEDGEQPSCSKRTREQDQVWAMWGWKQQRPYRRFKLPQIFEEDNKFADETAENVARIVNAITVKKSNVN